MDVALYVTLVASLAIPTLGWWVARRVDGGAVAILSHPFAFGVYWWVSYPLKATLLFTGVATTQTGFVPEEADLLQALGLSGVLALILVAGSARALKHAVPLGTSASVLRPTALPWSRAWSVLGLCVLASLYTMLQTVWKDFSWNQWAPYEQNMARHGRGWLFFWIDSWTYVAMSLLAAALYWRRTSTIGVNGWIWIAAVATALVLWAYITGVAFASRRMIVALVYAAAVVGVIAAWRTSHTRWAFVLALAVAFGPSFGAATLDSVRYAWTDTTELPVGDTTEPGGSFSDGVSESAPAAAALPYPVRYYLQNTVSTFEGVEHLARFIDRGGWTSLLTGVGHGEEWLFNAGLALIPRQLWTNKPVIAGSTAEQCWLWPDQCPGTRWDAAYLPPGFAVDFVFGFGIVGAGLLAWIAGWLLGKAHVALWQSAGLMSTALGLFSYVFLFNFIRGGTSFIQSLLIFFGLCVLAWGSLCLPKLQRYSRRAK